MSNPSSFAYLSIIYENECVYCMAGHSNLSRMAKVSDDVIAAVREGRPIADAKLRPPGVSPMVGEPVHQSA